MIYRYTSHPHIGDQIICTGAVRNVRLAHPEIMFTLPENCPEVCNGNADYMQGATLARELGKITYGSLEDEQQGRWGNVVEGFTRSLCILLGLPLVPIVCKRPVLVLTDDEKEYAERFKDAIILNGNCQKCSMSKGNPYWQEVVDQLRKDWRIIQVGGNETRDISPDLRGVEDWRGKTTLRQLMAMVHGSALVVSPPSAISNMAGAFQHRQVIVNASREPDILLAYENALHVSHRCECGWGVETGCITCRLEGVGRVCQRPRVVGARAWCQCQAETTAESIITAIRALLYA